MSYLTADELAAIREHLAETLPDTCAIYAESITVDGAGRQVQSWAARGTAIPCRIAPGSGGGGGITAEQIKEGLSWTLSVAYDQTVEVGDKVVCGGRAFQVNGVNHAESELGLTRAYMELLE